MEDRDKTKEQLISELSDLRQRVGELEESEFSLKDLEGTLREKLELLEKILNNASAGIFILDENVNYVYINPTCGILMGIDQNYWIGKRAGIGVHPDFREIGQKQFDSAIGGEPGKFQIRLQAADGAYRTVSVDFTPIKLKGKPHLLGLVRDITERVKAEETLRETMEMYQTLLKTSPDAIAVTDLEGNMTEVSERILEVHGFDNVEEMLGMNAFDLIAPEDRERAGEDLEKNITEGFSTTEYKLLKKDGSTFIGETNMALIKDAHGQPKAICAVIRDVTERKQAEAALRNSEEKYRTLINTSPDGIVVMSLDGKLLESNQAFQDMVGYSSEELEAIDYRKLTPKKWHEIEAEAIKAFMPVGFGTFEKEYIRKDGTTFPISLTGWLIKDEKGNPEKISAFIKDITERKRTEKARLESELQYRTTLDSMSDMIHVIDRDFRFILMNEALKQMSEELGLEANPIGKKVLEFFSFLPDKVIDEYKQVFETGETVITEEHLELNGREFFTETRKIPIIEDEKVERVVTVIRDTTEHMQSEEAIREAEEKYGSLFDRTLYSVYMHDLEGNFLDANDAALKLLGYSRDEITSLNMASLIVEKERMPEAIEAIEEIKKYGNQKSPMEWKLATKSGDYVWIETEGSAIYNKGKLYAIQGIARDITERKLAEKALAAEKERLAVTLRSIGDGVITTDIDGRVFLINKVAEALTGWSQEEVVGKPLSEVFHTIDEKTREPTENPVQKVLEKEGITELPGNSVLIDKHGTERMIADSVAPIRDIESKIVGVVVVFRDITEKRMIEEELFKSKKIESVGILAGGIAHDFNNILTGILGNISLAKRNTDANPKLIKPLTEAENACERAKNLTQQLLTFSRGGAPIKKTVSVAELLRDTVEFSLSGSNVRCRYSISENIWPSDIDEGQISQVINNLIINAVQAMPGGGIIEVYAENIYVNNETGLPLQNGKYVGLKIKDRGTGIPEEHLEKIFDPFFSTKQQGSGLGLAISYSIISKHNGHITLESELGIGTTFLVYLPASDREIETKEQDSLQTVHGEGNVLLMDDEEIVRKVAGEMIEYLGYNVAYAEDGAEAIALYVRAAKSDEPFDLVIMDLTIAAGLGGKETIEKLLKIDPDAKAIVSSGYSTDPVMANYSDYGFQGVIKKPYKLEEISRLIKDIING